MFASKALRSEDNEDTTQTGTRTLRRNNPRYFLANPCPDPSATFPRPPTPGVGPRYKAPPPAGSRRARSGTPVPGGQGEAGPAAPPGLPALGAEESRSPVVWGRAVQPGAQAAAAGAASHVATGAAGPGRKPPRAARPHLARERAGPRDWEPRARGAGGERSGAPRERGAGAEVPPGASSKFLGAQPTRTPPGLGPQLQARAGAVWKGRQPARGRGGRALLFTSFPNSPPWLRPAAARRRGEAGAPGTPGSLPAAASAAGVRVGVGPARCPQVQTLPACATAPRASRGDLERLGRGCKGRRARNAVFPLLRLAPRRARGWSPGAEVSAELSGFLPPSRSEVGIAGHCGEGTR